MSPATETRLENSSSEDPRRPGWWHWTVWVEAPGDVLRQIKSVRYTLHPTFPDPVKVQTDRESKFRLEGAGWGEFEIHAELSMKDGSTRDLDRWLTFADTEASPAGAETARPRPVRRAGGRRGDDVAGRRGRVFVAHSISDGPFVRDLTARLADRGIQAVTDADVPGGVPLEHWLERTIAGSDAVVVMLCDVPGASVLSEARVAIRARRPIIPVLRGTGAVLPNELRDYQAVHIPKDDQAAESLASQIESALARA
jgi:hypothetical protein